ncbi:MAG: hypothetical protein LBG06_10555, partial [Deltaproteobacteria bacterium]|nr:hypothetical protein [Deltaproteobacteria bacterium]
MTQKSKRAKVFVKVPCPDQVVHVRVTPPDSLMEVKVSPEGLALEIKVFPRGRTVEVHVTPAPDESDEDSPSDSAPEEGAAPGPPGPAPPDSTLTGAVSDLGMDVDLSALDPGDTASRAEGSGFPGGWGGPGADPEAANFLEAFAGSGEAEAPARPESSRPSASITAEPPLREDSSFPLAEPPLADTGAPQDPGRPPRRFIDIAQTAEDVSQGLDEQARAFIEGQPRPLPGDLVPIELAEDSGGEPGSPGDTGFAAGAAEDLSQLLDDAARAFIEQGAAPQGPLPPDAETPPVDGPAAAAPGGYGAAPGAGEAPVPAAGGPPAPRGGGPGQDGPAASPEADVPAPADAVPAPAGASPPPAAEVPSAGAAPPAPAGGDAGAAASSADGAPDAPDGPTPEASPGPGAGATPAGPGGAAPAPDPEAEAQAQVLSRLLVETRPDVEDMEQSDEEEEEGAALLDFLRQGSEPSGPVVEIPETPGPVDIPGVVPAGPSEPWGQEVAEAMEGLLAREAANRGRPPRKIIVNLDEFSDDTVDALPGTPVPGEGLASAPPAAPGRADAPVRPEALEPLEEFDPELDGPPADYGPAPGAGVEGDEPESFVLVSGTLGSARAAGRPAPPAGPGPAPAGGAGSGAEPDGEAPPELLGTSLADPGDDSGGDSRLASAVPAAQPAQLEDLDDPSETDSHVAFLADLDGPPAGIPPAPALEDLDDGAAAEEEKGGPAPSAEVTEAGPDAGMEEITGSGTEGFVTVEQLEAALAGGAAIPGGAPSGAPEAAAGAPGGPEPAPPTAEGEGGLESPDAYEPLDEFDIASTSFQLDPAPVRELDATPIGAAPVAASPEAASGIRDDAPAGLAAAPADDPEPGDAVPPEALGLSSAGDPGASPADGPGVSAADDSIFTPADGPGVSPADDSVDDPDVSPADGPGGPPADGPDASPTGGVLPFPAEAGVDPGESLDDPDVSPADGPGGP